MFPCSYTLSECFRTVIFRILFPVLKNWLMFPCSLRYFVNVPLFPKTPGRPSFFHLPFFCIFYLYLIMDSLLTIHDRAGIKECLASYSNLGDAVKHPLKIDQNIVRGYYLLNRSGFPVYRLVLLQLTCPGYKLLLL